MSIRCETFLLAVALVKFVELPNEVAGACDVGDVIEAVFAGTGLYHPGNISAIDLSPALSSVQVTVIWQDSSPAHRQVLAANTRKDGVACQFLADAGQSFSMLMSTPSTMRVKGPSLTEACRLLIVDPAEECGSLSATLHVAASSPPGAPVGSVDMFFFEVVVSAAGSYKICFWSGTSVGGLTAVDLASYATTLGVLSVLDATTTTTTSTSIPAAYSRRRGLSYDTTSLRVEASSGAVFTALTANPAAWNVYLPRESKATCRTCQRYVASEVDRNLHSLRLSQVEGFLQAAPGESAADLGTGCSGANVTAPQTPSSVMLVLRGQCPFAEKARMAAAGGYVGVLVVNHLADTGQPLADMAADTGDSGLTVASTAADGSGALVPVPGWLMPRDEGEAVFGLLGVDPVVAIRVEDTTRKLPLSTGLSDAAGVRLYERW